MSLNKHITYNGVNARSLYQTPGGRVFTSLEELNQEYDIDASVPDFNSIGEWFARESAKAREELQCTLDIPYGPTRAERLDVFHGEPGGPVVVFIHGGYWRMLTSKEFSFVARGLAAQGATVVIPTYALCPAVTIDEIVRQHRAAITWTYNHATEFGADPQKLVVTGHSAGAHGVAMVLATDWENEYGLPADIIRGACAISGLFDLQPLPYTFVQPFLQLTWDQVLRNSPILNLPKSAPPLLVTRGGKQTSEFLRQSDDFYTAWQSSGLPGEYWIQPERNHFDELFPLTELDSELTKKIIKLAIG
ncbi:alpha/beta hydrolase [Lysinibacillus sp. 3P01SB]|uniref:alpha/beta hydrolase n=1 Tax=Lysinibacillus sp. 3P01SB TaxID=3132284 RepID=UPI0039A54D15